MNTGAYGQTASTFRVVGSNGGTMNLIKTASTENPSDAHEVRVEKRRQEAELKRQQWYYNYFSCLGIDETLSIVACDSQGYPLLTPEPVVPSARFTCSHTPGEQHD